MADFLSRLAARVLGEARVARPIIPTVFEPAGVTASNLGAESMGLAEPAMASEPAEHSPKSIQMRPAVGDLLMPRHHPEVTGEGFTRSETSSLTDYPASPNAAVREKEVSRPIAFAQPRAPEVRLISGHTQGRGRELVADPVQSQPRRLVSPPARLAPEAALLAERTKPGSASPEITTSRRFPAAGPGVQARAAVESSEPVIRVTIGRVEVRAVFPPAAPASKPRGVSPLPLEEYLKQRREGRR